MKQSDSWKDGLGAVVIALAATAGFGGIGAAAQAATQAAAATSTSAAKPNIVVLGDSLSAEYGLPRDTGWVALMRARIADRANRL